MRFLLSTLILLFPLNLAFAEEGMNLLKEKCVSCHNISGSSPTTLEEALKRKGPDLFYAGVKYKAEWLESWLQNPKRLRPAGYRYFEVIKSVEGKVDTIDKTKLTPHPSVNKDEAVSITKTLMSLKAKANLIKGNALTSDPVSMMMGEMNFDKFSGCLACHEIEPGFGGVTGPEVYTIGKRLQPDYIYSYVSNPQAWDPKTIMPNKQLGENFIQTLTKFMIELAKEGN